MRLFRKLNAGLDQLVVFPPAWVPTLFLVPALYGLGWIKAQMLTLIGLPAHAVSIVGTLFSFLLFLLVMPRWVRLRWKRGRPWQVLGITARDGQAVVPVGTLWSGLLWAVALLMLVTVPILLGPWGLWIGDWSLRLGLDAMVLLFGVGMAEELIFRGWLWEELNQMVGPRGGLIGQAVIFSLVHTRFNLGVIPMLGLLTGLFLLGLALAVRRRLDRGSLWGCIGLHGGLVSGWFVLENGLLSLSADTPTWLAGPGAQVRNPLGGAVAVTALTLLLWHQRKALAKDQRPTSTRTS